MEKIFINMLTNSLAASVIVLCVLIIRVIIKKAPKWISCILWVIVGVRLICPINIQSNFSLMPDLTELIQSVGFISGEETESDDTFFDNLTLENASNQYPIEDSIKTDISTSEISNSGNSSGYKFETEKNAADFDGEQQLPETEFPQKLYDSQTTGRNTPRNMIVSILCVVWLVGIFSMCVYYAVSVYRIKGRVKIARKIKDNVYLCDLIETPFLLGVLCPKIYLPNGMSEVAVNCVIEHEKAHMLRHDNLWKPIGFFVLAIYWMNPLCWISYKFLCKDIELACDEYVTKHKDKKWKADYCQTLLDYEISKTLVSSCPIAFGEGSVKMRIKSIINYKKPAFVLVVIALLLCVVVSVCLLTNPKSKGVTLPKLTDEQLDAFYQAGVESNSDKLLGFNNFDVVALNYDGQIYTMSLSHGDQVGFLDAEDNPYIDWDITLDDYPLEKICDVYGDVFVKPVYGDANADGHISGVYAWHQDVNEIVGEYRQGTLWKFGNYDEKNIVALTEQVGEHRGKPTYALYIFYHLNDITLETGKDLLDIILDPMKACRYGVQTSRDPLITLSGNKPEDILFLGDLYKGTVISEEKVTNREAISRIWIYEKAPYYRNIYFDNYGDGIIGYKTPEGTSIYIKTDWNEAKASEKNNIENNEVHAGNDFVAVIRDGKLSKYALDGTLIKDSYCDEIQGKFVSFSKNDRENMIAITEEGTIYVENPVSKEDIEMWDIEMLEAHTNVGTSSAKVEVVEGLDSFLGVQQLLCIYPIEYTVLFSDGEVKSIPEHMMSVQDSVKKISWTHGLTLLLDDGRVICSDYEYKLGDEYTRNDILKLRDIDDISEEGGLLVAIGKDGKVYCEDKKLQKQTDEWEDICQIAYSNSVLIALDKQGRVYSAKGVWAYDQGQTQVEGWTDIVSIDTNGHYTVGLKRDGSFVICGKN